MNFKRYGSIDNVSRVKTVDYIIETGNSGGEWVSTLKIHGANYSIWYDENVVRTGKRSGFIKGNSFYGDNNFDYTENVKEMYNFIKNNIPSMKVLSIHGEIYGGIYNHPDVDRVDNATRVQKEVQYRPDNDFIVFDIKVDGIILDHDMVVMICNKFDFRHVPVLARGKFSDLIGMEVKFHDPLAGILGLPEIKENYAEGWVVKPVTPKFFGNGERIILKGKNPDLIENTGRKVGKPHKPIYNLTDDANRLLNIISGYINENRLRNVISHGDIETITQKDFGKLLGLFCQDIYGDFLKDNGDEFNELDKKDQVCIKKNMNRIAADVIRPNFVNIIDGEF